MSLAADMLVNDLRATLGMLKMTVSDLSDADMFQRPVPNANHPFWQIGHLCASESHMINKYGQVPSVLPADFAAKFKNRETNHEESPEFFKMSKDQLMQQFEAVRESTIRYTQGLSDDDFVRPTNWQMAPTLGAVIGLQLGHTQMHVGQIQVLRRKLGKPILF